MKNLKSIFFYCILSVLTVFGISSCKKDSGQGAPTITKVRTVFKGSVGSNVIVPFDSTTNDGKILDRYVIIGNNLGNPKELFLNGVSIYFNPALASNTALQFSIPKIVPFSNSSTNNMLTLVTANGTVSVGFVVQQPLPIITTIDQLAGNAGDIITITGTTFNGLSSVMFGTTAGEIITKTPTLITVKVPTGITTGPVTVTTSATLGGGVVTGPVLPSGTSQLKNNGTAVHQATALFGFTNLIFDDSYKNNWYTFGSPTIDATIKKRGTSSIKASFSGGFGNIGFKLAPLSQAVSPKAAIKFSLYGGPGSNNKKVRCLLNNNYDASSEIVLVEGKWTDYVIATAYLASPLAPQVTSINQISFQEYSGNTTVFYLDDFGIVDLP